MRVAVASMNEQVAEHFGLCESFLIYDSVTKQAYVFPNPGHKPGFLPNFLADKGVEVIIAGGMGGGAVQIFIERDIEVVVGACGDAKTAALDYLKGDLKTTGSVCHEHQHHDECGE